MGLDIYLSPIGRAQKNKLHGAIWDEDENGEYPRKSMTDDEIKAYETEHPYVSHEGVPSEQFPDHLFNRRYLRSSYNAGGFNHAVPDMLGTAGTAEYPNARGSIYWIFEPMGREWDGDEGILTAADVDALRASKARALEIEAELGKCDRLRVTTASPNMFREPPTTTKGEALAKYRQQVADGRIKSDGGWSNIDMDTYGTEGLLILAAIPGRETFNVPGVHLIYRQADDGYDSYIQSAHIIAEFCDEAIALIERDGSCEMSWSG